MEKKPVIGFYDLTGCNGCLLSFLFNEDELLDLAKHVDIKTFRFVKGDKDDKHYDYVFVEGLVACNKDLETLKDIRLKSDKLVAFGACACTGCVPAYRNFIDTSKYAYLVYEKSKEYSDVPATPINHHVQVDFYLPGCPPDKKQIASFIKDIALGKKYPDYDKPVCFECRLNENRCLLDDKKMCLGPVTKGGCNAVCTNSKLECWGCRGPTPDADIPLMTKLLEQKGFAKDHIKQRIRTFSGMALEKPDLKVVKPQKIKKKEPKKVKAVKKTKIKKEKVEKKKEKTSSKKIKTKKSKQKIKKTVQKKTLNKKMVKTRPKKQAKPKEKPKPAKKGFFGMLNKLKKK